MGLAITIERVLCILQFGYSFLIRLEPWLAIKFTLRDGKQRETAHVKRHATGSDCAQLSTEKSRLFVMQGCASQQREFRSSTPSIFASLGSRME